MRTIKEHAGLIDCWEAVHGPMRRASRKIDPHSAIACSGVTIDSPQNTFTKPNRLDDNARLEYGKRFDYVLFRGPIGQAYRPRLANSHARVVFTELVPDRGFSYSTHFGVEATFTISPPPSHYQYHRTPDPELERFFTGAPPADVARQVLECRAEAGKTARLERWTAGLCAAIVLGLASSAAWLPRHWLHPLWTLFSAGFAVLGLTLFFSGFLYGKWEDRVLTSVVEELEYYKAETPATRMDDARWQQRTVV